MDLNKTDVWKPTFLGYSDSNVATDSFSKVQALGLFSCPQKEKLQQLSTVHRLHVKESAQERLNGFDCFTNLLRTDSFQMSTLLLAVTLVSVVLLWYPLRYWWKLYNLRSAKDLSSPLSHLPLPPGSFGLPIIGETISWIAQGPKFNSNRRKKYGNVFKTSAITLPMVKVTGHEFVKQVLKGEHDKVTTIWPSVVRLVLGENVLVNSTGDAHFYKRKVACKAFTSAALNGYIPSLHKNVIKNVQAMADMERPRMYDEMLKLTFELGVSALLGFNLGVDEMKNSYSVFHNLVSNIFSMPYRIPGLGFDKAMKARAELLDSLQEHIRIKREHIKEKIANGSDFHDDNGTGPAALDIILRQVLQDSAKKQEERANSTNGGLINNNNEYDQREVSDEEDPVSDLALKEMSIELMFAGYYTSASALTSCILELARNPDVFRKVEEELLDHGLLTTCTQEENNLPEINIKLIHELTYMEQVLKETLRMRPPVLGGYRKAKKTFQIGRGSVFEVLDPRSYHWPVKVVSGTHMSDGNFVTGAEEYRIPKGWYVIYNIRDTHDFEYEDMDVFDPDRFAPGNNLDDRFKFIPFGGGPRTCVGREYARLMIKLILIEMFRHYRKWELADKKLPRMKAIPTLCPVGGLPLNLFSRERVGVVTNPW